MEMTFEHTQKVADGHNPIITHLPDHECYLFYTVNTSEGREFRARQLIPGAVVQDYDWTNLQILPEETERVTLDRDVQRTTTERVTRYNPWVIYNSDGKGALAPFPFRPDKLFHPKVWGRYQDPVYNDPLWIKEDGRWKQAIEVYEKQSGSYHKLHK